MLVLLKIWHRDNFKSGLFNEYTIIIGDAGVPQKVEHQTSVFDLICYTCDRISQMTKIRNTKIGSVYAFLDARTPMANSQLLPVKISVILRGEQFRVGVKLYTTPDIFNKAMTGKGGIPREAKMFKDEIEVYVKKAKDILDQFPNADKKMFTNLFKSETALKVSGKTDMAILFKQKIDELTEEDRAGSISFYEQALSTFKRFKKYFYLEDITVEYLKEFKAWWINPTGASVFHWCLYFYKSSDLLLSMY